jgi:adenylate cyclase
VSEVTTSAAARTLGVSAATLRRWVKAGAIPQFQGEWTASAYAQARIVARLRARGHALKEIVAATEAGRLAYSHIEDVLPRAAPVHTVAEVARLTRLEPALIERIRSSVGFAAVPGGGLSDSDLELLRLAANVLGAGLPLVAFLQLVRVYGQSLAQIADAEVRLFHIYVHEPLMRQGVSGTQIAEEMEGLARQLLPAARPMMELIHERLLAQYVEQDIIGHMESDLDEASLDLGRLRVAILFADLAGYTRLTEERGDEQAVDVVESFVEAVELTLPDEARVIKTLGDEVMVVGSDPAALTEWAVGFQTLYGSEPPLPRIGIHYGETLYRDGDYYGSEVNKAARVVARAAAGEVLVTSAVVEQCSEHLEFEPIGEVTLKGFSEATKLFVARAADDADGASTSR